MYLSIIIHSPVSRYFYYFLFFPIGKIAAVNIFINYSCMCALRFSGAYPEAWN